MKKLLTIALSVIMLLQMAVFPVIAADTAKSYVYYDFESVPASEHAVGTRTHTAQNGKTVQMTNVAARLYREYATVKTIDGAPAFSLESSAAMKVQTVSFLLNSDQEADYSPTNRMVSLRFRFTAQAPDLVKQIWQSLAITSKATLEEYGHTLPAELAADAQILYFYRNFSGLNYSVPICVITADDWHEVTYLYDEENWQAVDLYLDGVRVSELLDGSALAGTDLIYRNSYKFLPIQFIDDAATRVPIMSIGKSSAATDSLQFSRIRYEGYTAELDGLTTNVDSGDNATSFPADGTLSVQFTHPMNADTLDNGTVQLLDAEGMPVSYTGGAYDAASRCYTIDLSSAPLAGNSAYTLSVTTAVKTVFGDAPTQSAERRFFTADGICAQITDVQAAAGAVTVTVENVSNTAQNVTMYGSAYEERSGGRLASFLGSQTKPIAPAGIERFTFTGFDPAQGFAKFFIWDGMQVLGRCVRFDGEAFSEADETAETEMAPETDTGITLETPVVNVNTGLVTVTGYYHDLPKRSVSVLLKNMAEDQVLYTEQCMTDKNGAFILTMVMPQGTTAGAYPIYLQAGAMTEPVRKTLELDFTAAEPAVTDLSVSGTVFVGEPVAAQYVYTHMAAVDEGDSEIIWYVADTADAPFTEVIPGATGKTLSLPEAYAYRYIGYQVTPKTIGGVTGETVTSGAFRVYARPTVTEVTLQTENGALVVNYSYSHIRGYGEKNHRFQWFKSTAADGDYTEISGVDSARYQPAASDSGSYFKVIMTPGADVPADEAAAAYGNPTESTACLWKGGSSTGGTTGNKNTGATGRGGGSSTPVSGKPSDPVTPPSDGNKTFSDVPADHWAKAAIDRLQAMGIVSGVSDRSFEPNRPVTRAEFIKMLLLAMGLAPKAYDGSFSDVTADAWYAGFVQAAYENGLADGSDGAFMPDQRISREAMAKMLVTAYENLRGTVAAETAGFTDSEAFSDWAAPYIHKAVAAGLMQGMDDGSFNGRGAADRAQVAAVIARFYDGAVKGGNSQ